MYKTCYKSTSYIAIAAVVLVLLAVDGCGFTLRGTANLPYDTLFVSAANSSAFAAELRRAVTAGSKTRVIDAPKEAQATLQLLAEVREKIILSLSGGGRVREFQLRYRVAYQLIDKEGKVLRPPTQIALFRDLSYNDADTIAKESEEALLYRDMQTDAVSQLMRQLQTVQTVRTAP